MIYLIVFYIWKYRLTPSEIFIKCNVKSKIMLLRIVSEAKMEESINEYINAKEFNESQSIIDKFDLEICSIINSLCLCVKNKNDNAEEKAAILGIFNELRKVMIGRVASMSALLIGQKILEAINISLEIKDDFFYKLLLDCFESMFYMRFQKNEKKINNYKLLISEISKSNISETQKKKEIEEIKKEMMIKEHIQNIKTRSLTFISEITNRANSSSEVDK